MTRVRGEGETACPFINGDDGRCAKQFSLGRLDRAFDLCLGGYLSCSTYYQLAWEQRREPVGCGITINGEPVAQLLARRGQRGGRGAGERHTLRPTGS